MAKLDSARRTRYHGEDPYNDWSPSMIVTKRTRRTSDQLIKDLQARIAEIKARAERRKVKSDPALRHVSAAVRSIDKALAATADAATRQALSEPRVALAAVLSLNGAAPKADRGTLVPHRRPGARVDAEAVLAHVQKHPGQGAQEIATAVGTDVKGLRPVMQGLIRGGQVRAKGKARGTRYVSG